MSAQEIIWTALPWGFVEDQPRLSVFISPRLTSRTSRLDEFPDFLTWPTRVNALTFTIETDDGRSRPAERISVEADLALWQALFRPDTFVEPFKFKDFNARMIRTLPIRGVTQYLNGLYGNVAKISPDELPKLYHEDEDDEETVGALTSLVRDVGGIFPIEVSDVLGDLVGDDDEETARVFGLPRHLSGLATVMRAAPASGPQVEELTQSPRFTALDPVLREARVIDTRAAEKHGFPSKVALDFYQTNRFYDRPENAAKHLDKVDLKKIPPRPQPPKIDFHKMLSLLGDHPYLMRRLGIVVDLVTSDIPAEGKIRVRAETPPDQALQSTKQNSPWTSYQSRDRLFIAAPLPKDEIEDGMLRLDDANDDPDSTDTDYDLIQVDIDGAALKATTLAANTSRKIVKDRVELIQKIRPEVATALKHARAAERPTVITMAREALRDGISMSPESQKAAAEAIPVTPPPPERAGLSPLRSAGIAVARAGRAMSVAERIRDASERNEKKDEEDIVHFGDHLIRGYRIDILDEETEEWYSLCRRVGNYRLQAANGRWLQVEAEDGSADILEEGYVKGASTTSDGSDSADLYLHETMFRWDGWSLAAPRAGRTIRAEVDEATGLQREIVERPQATLSPEFKMESTFRVEPGTLPRLRFGHTYKVRARCVDLAGNSLAMDEVIDEHASEAITYVRFDPVVPPVLVPRARFAEGESLERMVIRSNFDVTPDQYATLAAVKTALEGVEHTYGPTNDRHVVPPKTSQLMAETHGAFDDWIGKGKSHTKAYNISIREAGTLDHTHVVVDEDANGNPVYEPVEGSEMILGKPAKEAAPEAPVTGSYLVNTKARFPLSYLPDWLARGIIFRGLPGTDEPYVHEYEGDWPDKKPIVIRIAEREGSLDPEGCVQRFEDTGEPSFEDGTLTVFLPKGETAKVRYSTLVPNEEARRMGQTRWLRDKGRAPESSLLKVVDRGDHWMFTPSRELILVHAVQQPLCPPEFVVRQVNRLRQPQAAAHKRLGETFASITGLVRLSVKTTAEVDLLAKWEEPKDLLTDDKWKVIEGAGHVATLSVDPRLPEPEVAIPFPDMDRVEPGTTPKQVMEMWERLVSRGIHHEFGDTKHRWVNYRLVGTSRFREYFPPEITKDRANLTREGDSVRLNVLSSARPDGPRVEYIVPTFKWEEEVSESGDWTLKRTRLGGGLRVYLHRPWFSSGEGELLGVVLWTKAFSDLVSEGNDRFRALVSMFGQDPIWASPSPDPALDRTYFPQDRPYEEGLSLDETQAETVGVVGFEPEFDEQRKMWFCDIELSHKAQYTYYPFIRLALARYQPDSLPEVKLSRVVQTDFAQVAPNRVLTVKRSGDRTFDVSVYGPAPEGPFPNRVEVEIQAHDGEVKGDLGWEPVPGTTDHPNPVILTRGFPDESWAPKDIPVSLVKKRMAGRRETVPSIDISGEAPESEEGTHLARAVEPGVAMHFAAPISRGNLPLVDAGGLMELVPSDLPPAVVSRFPAALLRGFEMWSGSITLPDDIGKDPVRILVCEFETFLADPEVGKLDVDRAEPQVQGHYLDRVVYADTVELPKL